MELSLSKKQFRRLLDLAYIGNWILNSQRGEDRFTDYDEVESLLFHQAAQAGMDVLTEYDTDGTPLPSRAFIYGGIHDAIAEYEDRTFFDILAEELAFRDLDIDPRTRQGEDLENDPEYQALWERMEQYIKEFELHGTENIQVEL